MELKKFIKYIAKTKRLTKKSLKGVSGIPLKKIVIGTTVMVLPGGIVISSVYVVIKELNQRYQIYVENLKIEGKEPESFSLWLNKNYVMYLKDKKSEAVGSVSGSIGKYQKKIKHYTVNKLNKIMKKKK